MAAFSVRPWMRPIYTAEATRKGVTSAVSVTAKTQPSLRGRAGAEKLTSARDAQPDCGITGRFRRQGSITC